MIGQAHAIVDVCARLLELAGAAIILGGVVAASIRFVVDGRRSGWSDAYPSYRANLGRGILLGLELLVGADIIATITAPLTFERGTPRRDRGHPHHPQLLAGDGDRGLLALAPVSP